MINNRNAKVAEWVIFILPLVIYIYQLCPTVYVHDSGELITASYVLGIAHPAGSPLYCMIGKLFQLIIPVGNIAFKMNAMSAFFAALAVLLLFHLIYKITADIGVSVVISLLFAFSYTFWSQALVAEVYTMANFVFLCALYFLIEFFLTKESIKLNYFSLFWGLLLTIHMEYSLMTPFIWLMILYYIKRESDLINSVKQVLKISIFFVIGLLPYIYLPIRSKANPIIDWGNPETLINFYYHITAKNVQKRMFTLGLIDYVERLKDYFMIILGDTLFLGIIGLLFLIIGFKRLRYVQLLLIVVLFVDCFFIVFLDEVPIQSEAYGIPSVLSSLIAFSYYKNLLIKLKIEKFKFAFLILPFVLLFFHFAENDRSNNFIPYDYNLNLLYQMPKDSILFSREDNRTFIMLYLQAVERRRKDITIYDTANDLFKNPYPENLFLKSNDEVLKIREQIESKVVHEAKKLGKFVFYTDPDMPFVSNSFNIQPCGLLGLAVGQGSSFIDYFFCKYDWAIRGEDDLDVKKDWMSKAIIAMNNYNYAQYMWHIDVNKAIQYLRQASIQKGYYAELHYMIGRSYLNHNYANEAVEEFEIATSINRRLWQAYIQKAFIYGKIGNYDNAIKEAKLALSIDENIADAHEYLAIALYKKDNLQDAEYHFLKAVNLQPDNVSYIYNTSNFYVRTGKIDEAERFLLKYISLNNHKNDQLNLLIIDLYRKNGQWKKLINLLTNLISLVPDKLEYYNILAETYIRIGDYESAKNIISEVLNKGPNNSIALQLKKIIEGN